jgi:hypothetical protein
MTLIASRPSIARLPSGTAVALSAVYVPESIDLLAALREIRGGLPAQVPLLVGGAATPEIAAEAEAAGALVIASLPEPRSTLRRPAAGEAG